MNVCFDFPEGVKVTLDRLISLSLGRLLKQGEYGASLRRCVYFQRREGKRPLKCAIGVLLPDSLAEKWEQESGGGSLSDVLDAYPELVPYQPLSQYAEAVLDALQSYHDVASVEHANDFISGVLLMARHFHDEIESIQERTQHLGEIEERL